MRNVLNTTKVLFIAVILSFITACGGGSSGSSSGSSGGTSSGGTSGGSSNYGSQLMGVWKLTSPDPGGTVTISFSSTGSSGSGENVIDVPGYAREVRAYTYSISGDTISFNYSDPSIRDTPSDIVSVTSTTLKLYNPDTTTGTYTKVGSSGSGSSGSGSSGSGSSTSACETNGTGIISIYTSTNYNSPVSVRIDGSTAGTLTSYYPSGSPTCGTPVSGGNVVRTVSAGSHTVSATATSGSTSWPASSYTVPTCRCININLQ